MPKILVSYRRSDSQAIAGRIFDRLSARYGDESVFMDIDNIPFGIDFREHIQSALAQGDLLIAVIGPRWLGASADGARIREEADPVRVEIEAALRQKMAIVPVLVDGASMPKPEELPDTLKEFAFINAAPIDIGRDFRQHMERLIRTMDQILAPRAAARSGVAAGAAPSPTVPAAPVRSRKLWLAVPAVLAVSAAGLWAFIPPAWFTGASPPPPPRSEPLASRFPAYKGRVNDEPGFLHPDTRAKLVKKLEDLEGATKVQVAVALLQDLPKLIPLEFADELSRRWKVGGAESKGALLIIDPSQFAVALHVGAGVQDQLNSVVKDLIVQGIGQRLQAKDVVGGLMQGVDDIVEVLTGDAKSWQARRSGAPPAVSAVEHPAPPPVTYRILPNVSGGVQNMRAGPATKYPIVVAIPAGAMGITISTCRESEDGTRPWCAANWRTYSGWVSICCIVDEKTGAPPRIN